MRKLIWVPVIHNYADMGMPIGMVLNSQGEFLEFHRKIDGLWDVIGMELSRINPDFPKTQIYMDSWHEGLTLRDAEMVAMQGSRNFQLIARYSYRGAQLMETETKELLYIPVSFRNAIRKRFLEPLWFHRIRERIIFEIYYWSGWLEFSSVVVENMDARDRYVAKRIQETLAEGGTGILFMGAMHNPMKYITDKDIEIVELPRVVVEAYRIMKEHADEID